MGGGDASAGEAQPLVLQRVGSVVPAAAYAGATIIDCRIFYLARAGCRKRDLTTPQGFLVFPLPQWEREHSRQLRDPRIDRRRLYIMDSIQKPQGRAVTVRAGGDSHCQAIFTAQGRDALWGLPLPHPR